jgi:hypothetical protein
VSTTIWEAVLKPLSEQRVRMPRGAKILSAQAQGNLPTIWFQCDPNEPIVEQREILLVETGRDAPHILNAKFKFIDTVQLSGGSTVIHVFARD